MFNAVKSRLNRFRRDDEGSIIAESVIMFPTLFAAVLAMFVFFDAFRNQSVNLKANYTIADSLSRQTEYVTNTYMNNMWNMHRFLTDTRHLTRMRISVISFDATANGGVGKHNVVWSRAKGGGADFTDAAISSIGLNKNEIPIMPNNEILIVVQTEVAYEPDFSVGLEGFTFTNTTYTRPRFNPDNLCYSHNNTHSGRVCPGDSS